MSEPTTAKTSPMVVAFGFYFLSVGDASCSLNTGICTVAIANEGKNSSYDLALAVNYCNMDLVYAKTNTTTSYTLANGTAGGQINNGLPHLTNVIATCTVPTSQLAYESNGAAADSIFVMKIVNSGPIPAGTTARVTAYHGAWTTSPPTTTSTWTSTVTATSTIISTTSATRTQTETTSETQTVIQTTTTIIGISQSATVTLYGSSALLGVGIAIATLILARRVLKR